MKDIILFFLWLVVGIICLMEEQITKLQYVCLWIALLVTIAERSLVYLVKKYG